MNDLVQPAGDCARSRGHCGAAFRSSNVRLDEMGPPASFGHRLGRYGRRAVVAVIAENHVACVLGEGLRDGEPDPFGSPGDKDRHGSIIPRRELRGKPRRAAA